MSKFRRISLFAFTLVTLLVVVAIIITFSVYSISTTGGEDVAFVGAVIGTILWLSSLLLLGKVLEEHRHAVTIEERLLGQRLVYSMATRSIGKFCLAATLILLFSARYHPVLLFLRAHPLTLYMLLIIGVVLFTTNDILEYTWYRLFYQFLSRRNTLSKRLSAITDVAQYTEADEDGEAQGGENHA